MQKETFFNSICESLKMTYRYPPPFMNKLTGRFESCPPVQMMNFNIPPPGFRPTCAMEMWHPNAYQCHPQPSPSQPSVLLPPKVHTVLQPQEWGQVNASCQEAYAHPTSDLVWVKDWLQRLNTTGTRSQQKQSAVPLKVIILCTSSFCVVMSLCHIEISILFLQTLVPFHTILPYHVNCYLNV